MRLEDQNRPTHEIDSVRIYETKFVAVIMCEERHASIFVV
jgi:hypothetical protein